MHNCTCMSHVCVQGRRGEGGGGTCCLDQLQGVRSVAALAARRLNFSALFPWLECDAQFVAMLFFALALPGLLDVRPRAVPVTGRSALSRLRGGAVDSGAATADVDHADLFEDLGTQLSGFMSTFRKLEEQTSTTCLPGKLGFSMPPFVVRARGDRVAMRQALGAVSKAMSSAVSDDASVVGASAALLEQLQLVLDGGAAAAEGAAVAALPEELASLRRACAQKPEGSVAAAARALRAALDAPLAAHARLAAATGGPTVTATASAAAAAPDAAAPDAAAPPPAALSRAQILAKLDGVPAFCVVDAQGEMVRPRDEAGEAGAAAFYIEPDDAKTALDTLRREPLASGGAEGLRLSVTPLGAAFEASGGWAGGSAEAAGKGGAAAPTLQGSRSVVEATAAKLREQVQGQGLEVGAWQVPIFCCGEMQTSTSTPFFFTHADLVEFWVAAGGKREEVPQQVALMDLRVLVAQMQTDAFPWSTAKLLCSRQAAELAGAVHKEAQE